MFLASALIAVFSISLRILYRLYFHPLARYPGPLLGRTTDWYSVYHCLIGDRHLDFVHLHAKYGPVVRYGPNRLSFSTTGALQAIYGSRANTKKSFWYDATSFVMKIQSTHSTTNKSQHSRKRRILSRALSDRMMPVYEGRFLKLLDEFLQRFEPASQTSESPPVFDMSREFTLFNFDSMGQFCFGEKFGSLQHPDNAMIVEKTHEAFRGLNAIGHMPWLSWLKLDSLMYKTKKILAEYEAYAAALARKCVQKFEESAEKSGQDRCVFDILYSISNQPDTEGFSLPELQSESSLLVTTGTDTAAAALSNLTFHLLNNPETMRRLTEEVRTSFTDISEIRMGTALNGCEYLAACIDESLRLTPVLAGCQLREVLSGGLNIDGDHIPQGVDVGVPHHVIMRSSKYYDFPLEYRPQRWMTSETSEDHIRSARAAFCPFGIGNTSCVGRKWALIEMQLTIARLLFRFDINMVMAETEKGLPAVGKLKSRQSRDLDCFVLKTTGPMLEFQLAKTSRGS